jgi:DNA-binding NtrC family response regulator
MCKFLVAEDSIHFRNLLEMELEKRGCDTECVSTVKDAEERIAENGIDCMILDMQLADGLSDQIITNMIERGQFIPCVVISAGPVSLPQDADKMGFMYFKEKPFTISEFAKELSDVIQTGEAIHDIIKETAELRRKRIELDERLERLMLMKDEVA